MTDPVEVAEEVIDEISHSDRRGNLDTPEDDDQVEPGVEPWVEDDNGAES